MRCVNIIQLLAVLAASIKRKLSPQASKSQQPIKLTINQIEIRCMALCGNPSYAREYAALLQLLDTMRENERLEGFSAAQDKIIFEQGEENKKYEELLQKYTRENEILKQMLDAENMRSCGCFFRYKQESEKMRSCIKAFYFDTMYKDNPGLHDLACGLLAPYDEEFAEIQRYKESDIQKQAEENVMAARGSYDAPGFDACVKAEMKILSNQTKTSGQ